MARMVATKAALSIRVDALTDPDGKSEPDAPSIGIENRAKLESRLRALEHQGELDGVRRFADGGKKQAAFRMTGPTKTYNTAGDAVVDEVLTTQRDPVHAAVQAVRDVKEEKRRAKEERRAKRKAEKEKAEDEEPDPGDNKEMDVDGDMDEKERKREKKRKRRESDAIVADAVTEEVSQFRSGDILPRIDLPQVTKGEETEAERKARKKARKAEKAKEKTPGGSATANGEVHEKKKKKKEGV